MRKEEIRFGGTCDKCGKPLVQCMGHKLPMQQEQQEITETPKEVFERIYNSREAKYRQSGIRMDDKYMHELNVLKAIEEYHKQELSKVLREAGKELPTISGDFFNWYHDHPNRDNLSPNDCVEWMRDKASLVIAVLKEELKEEERLKNSYAKLAVERALEIREKDSIIAAKDEEVKALKDRNEEYRIQLGIANLKNL